MNKQEISSPEVIEVSKKKLPKPYLLTRISASFLDFLLVIILFAGFEALTYFTLFEPLGYHQAIEQSHQVLDDSHLYVYDDNQGYLTITESYNNTLTPEENYDVPIVNYYGNNQRAIDDNRLNRYYDSKILSGYFIEESEGVFTRKTDIDDATVKVFFVTAYNGAVTFVESDPAYISGVQTSFYIVLFSSLISATLAMGIIHLLIPLLLKNGQTPFKLVFKLCLADARDDTRVKKSQIVYRFLILLPFNIWVPILLYGRFTYFTLIPIFVSIIMMSLTKSFSGPHDYVAKTYVVSNRDITIPERKIENVLIENR